MDKKLEFASKLQAKKNVIEWDLERSLEFDKLSDVEFIKIFNYFGPDSFPEILRYTLTWIFRHFIELSAVHDVDFHFSDGSLEGFEDSLRRWKNNSAIMLNIRYPRFKIWLLPLRWWDSWKLNASYKILRLHSYGFYIACYQFKLIRISKMETDYLKNRSDYSG